MRDSWLEPLPRDVCLRLLEQGTVGRIGVIVDDAPVVLPVNYRLIRQLGRTWVALRTRPDNVIDRGSLLAAFEIDNIDTDRQEGWSVLVRGTLHHVDADAANFRDRFDPEPWLVDDRDAWLIIEPYAITGRRLHSTHLEWAFHVRAYL
jgi:hypothetical protein